MSERKVLNKYYPPDFDPAKIPKLRLPRNRQYSIRIMAPFNMRCNTCGEYIYKGKKFNSRKETVETENYLGLHIFRFYIKCPRCVAEIAFKTDPENTDYALEDGATRNFEPTRTAEMLAEKERKEKEDEEANNPMKVLENRTKQSRQEMEMLETLEDLKELRTRHAGVNMENMLDLYKAYEEQLKKLQDEEDEEFVRSAFSKEAVKRLADDSDEEDYTERKKIAKLEKPTDILASTEEKCEQGHADSKKSLGSWNKNGKPAPEDSQSKLGMFVKKKPSGAQSLLSSNNLVRKVVPSGSKNQTAKTVSQGEKQPAAAVPASTNSGNVTVQKQAPTGLSLLGGYGDYSDSD